MPNTEPGNEREQDEVISILGDPVPTVTTTEARSSISSLLGKVEHAGARVVVTRSGKSVAALVTIADLELLSRILERIEDIEDMLEADRRLADPTQKQIPLEDVVRKLGL